MHCTVGGCRLLDQGFHRGRRGWLFSGHVSGHALAPGTFVHRDPRPPPRMLPCSGKWRGGANPSVAPSCNADVRVPAQLAFADFPGWRSTLPVCIAPGSSSCIGRSERVRALQSIYTYIEPAACRISSHATHAAFPRQKYMWDIIYTIAGMTLHGPCETTPMASADTTIGHVPTACCNTGLPDSTLQGVVMLHVSCLGSWHRRTVRLLCRGQPRKIHSELRLTPF